MYVSKVLEEAQKKKYNGAWEVELVRDEKHHCRIMQRRLV